jgi:dihydrofolate reductase
VWPYFENEGATFVNQIYQRADAFSFGRRTYEIFAPYWGAMADQGDNPIALALNTRPKYVVSTTLTDPSWQNTTVIASDVAGAVSKLKDETDGTILVSGSGTLVGALLEADLVDELRLMVFPTILGQGRRAFPDGIDRLKFRLADARTVGPDGVQVAVYERAS